MERILDHALGRGFSYLDERASALQALAEGVDPRRSPTFRRGKAGAWREHFSPETKALFKEVSGDLLIRLGYEEDHNW